MADEDKENNNGFWVVMMLILLVIFCPFMIASKRGCMKGAYDSVEDANAGEAHKAGKAVGRPAKEFIKGLIGR